MAALRKIESSTVRAIACEEMARTFMPPVYKLSADSEGRAAYWETAAEMVALSPSSLHRVASALLGSYSSDNAGSLPTDLLLEVIDFLLANPASYYWRRRLLGTTGIDDAPLRRGLAEDPHRTGLLVALAYCASTSDKFAPFDIDTYEAIIKPAPQSLAERCILLIRARENMLRSADREIVVRNISSDRSILGALASAYWQNADPSAVEEFLVSVYDVTKLGADARSVEAVLFEIDECVSLRSTILSTVDGWISLGFPGALFKQSARSVSARG